MIGLASRSRAWDQAPPLPGRPGGALLPLRVLLFGLAVPLLLRARPERLAARLEPAAPPPPPHPAVADALARRIDFWLRAGRPLVRRGCLTRGITRFWFLRRAGVPVSLRFGMGEVEGRIEGHCWLVRDGEPFLEPRDPREVYTETFRIPGGAPR